MAKYVDIDWVESSGARPQHWKRLNVKQLNKAIKIIKAKNPKHLYRTIQTFSQPAHTDNEESWSPFFIDLDNEKQPKNTLVDAVKIIDYLVKLGIDDSYIDICFSGNKGVHIVVPRKMFGAIASKESHKIWRLVARSICKSAKVKSIENGGTFDDTVYTSRRMWRVTNTINGKSDLYKIPLLYEELKDLAIGEIKQLAKTPQTLHVEPWEGGVIDRAGKLYKDALEAKDFHDNFATAKLVEHKFDKPPACIQYIMDEGVTELGLVNATMFRFAAYLKSQGTDIKETISILNGWSENIPPSKTHDLSMEGGVDLGKIRIQIQQVCRSVYAGENYGFSCSGMKEMPGIDTLCTDECKKDVEAKVFVTLTEAVNEENLGKRLYMNVEVIGKREVPYMIPDVVKVWCEPTGNPTTCSSCPLMNQSDGLVVKVNAKQKGILFFVLPSNLPEVAKVSKLCGLPQRKSTGGNIGCGAWKYSVKYINMEVAYISPRISNSANSSETYNRSSIFYLGFNLKTNVCYQLSGYTHIHTQTNIAHIVIDQAEPIEDSLETFTFTKDMAKRSRIFRPTPGQSYQDKHTEIANTFNRCLCRVWGRELIIRAIDLAYHSVRKVPFQEEVINGRLDILLMGDTGTGKTKIVASLMNHFQQGIMVSGESSGRTGLLYTISTKEKEAPYIIWGIFPRYHGRLVIVDELARMVETGEFDQFTKARSEGEVSVSQSVVGRAKAETRVISITNTVGRKTMKTHPYPVVSVMDLFAHREDIRRFTFVAGLQSGEIEDETINLDVNELGKFENPYTDRICHDHVLKIWTLEPNDIQFEAGVEPLILELALKICQDFTAVIPLVEPGDFRQKLVRIACAICARLDIFRDGKLTVTREGVMYAHDFFYELYSSQALKYLQYSRANNSYALNEEVIEDLKKELVYRWPNVWKFVCEWVLVNEYTNAKELVVSFGTRLDILDGVEEKTVRACLQWLSASKMLDTTSRGHFIKTEAGTTFLSTIMPEKFIDGFETAKEFLGVKQKEEKEKDGF